MRMPADGGGGPMAVGVDEERVRRAYDTVAVDYEQLLRDLPTNPYDHAMLASFASEVAADGGGAVAEVGCGPGRMTGLLVELGLDVMGIDLSPAMVAIARARHPTLRVEVGSMAALDLPDGTLAAIVAWYAVIHTPPAAHPALFVELRRVLRPGGRLLVAFQVGDESLVLDHAYGHDLDLPVHRLSPDRVTVALEQAGFTVTARLVRAADGEWERHPQAVLVARSDRGGGSPRSPTRLVAQAPAGAHAQDPGRASARARTLPPAT